MAPMVSSGISLTQVKCTDLQSNQANVGTNGTVTPGTRAGSMLPLDDCVLVNLAIATRYRGGKPRMYLPGGTANDTTDGRHWLPAFITSFQSAWNAYSNHILTNVSGITIAQQACVHYYKGYVTNPNGSPWEERNVPAHNPNAGSTVDGITAASVNPFVGQQRRRLRAIVA